METWEARAETGLTQAMPNTYRARQLSLPGDRERPERMCSNLSVLFLVHSRLKVLGEKKKNLLGLPWSSPWLEEVRALPWTCPDHLHWVRGNSKSGCGYFIQRRGEDACSPSTSSAPKSGPRKLKSHSPNLLLKVSVLWTQPFPCLHLNFSFAKGDGQLV